MYFLSSPAMFFLICCFLYTVSARVLEVTRPEYSRMYLRGLKRVETERIQTELITRGIAYIENAVFSAAKQGHLHYTTEPFLGCEVIHSELFAAGIDTQACEYVLQGIKTLVAQRFPDSELLYDKNTRRYTLNWE
jgi:hypothetical protein